MITVHGDLDTLLPAATDSDVYDQLVEEAGRGSLHRYYTVEDGTHTDGLYAAYPDRLRPLLPCARDGFELLTAWVERGVVPPADGFRPRPAGGNGAAAIRPGRGGRGARHSGRVHWFHGNTPPVRGSTESSGRNYVGAIPPAGPTGTGRRVSGYATL